MAEKYILKVTAGPKYDESTHSTVNVNSEKPLHIFTPSVDINLTVRIQNFRGLPRDSPKTSPYFESAAHTRDQYSIELSFIPKKPIPGQDLVFGNDFDHPIKDKLPPGFGTAFKIVKWAIDPGLEGDPYADEPYLYGGALSSFNVLRVGEKTEKLKEQTSDLKILEEGADGDGEEWRKSTEIPDDAGARKKYFLEKSHKEKFVFEEGRLYHFDFFNPYIDFNEFALKLPGFTLPVVKFWESKNIPLRYVLKNYETKEVYFVVLFTLLAKDDVEREEAQKIAEKKADLDGEGMYNVDDGGVD